MTSDLRRTDGRCSYLPGLKSSSDARCSPAGCAAPRRRSPFGYFTASAVLAGIHITTDGREEGLISPARKLRLSGAFVRVIKRVEKAKPAVGHSGSLVRLSVRFRSSTASVIIVCLSVDIILPRNAIDSGSEVATG